MIAAGVARVKHDAELIDREAQDELAAFAQGTTPRFIGASIRAVTRDDDRCSPHRNGVEIFLGGIDFALSDLVLVVLKLEDDVPRAKVRDERLPESSLEAMRATKSK